MFAPRTQKNSAAKAKLSMGDVNGSLEREADRVAEQVVHASVDEPPTSADLRISHMRSGGVELGNSARLRPTPGALRNTPVQDVLRSAGQPLDAGTRRFLEPRFGRDFSNVRVHADTVAGRSAEAINAQAYTAGNHIVFGAGKFTPGTHAGRKLLAHELTHVLQQSEGGAGRTELSHSNTSPPVVSVQRKPTELDLPFIGDSLILSNDSSVTFSPWATIGTYPALTSFSDFPAGDSGEVEIRAGTKSVVRMNMKVHIFQNNSTYHRNQTLNEQFHVDWDITAAPDGTLTLSNPRPAVDDSPGSSGVEAGLLWPVDVTPKTSTVTDTVIINPVIASTGGSSSTNAGVSGNVKGVGLNVNTGSTQSIPGRSVGQAFVLRIRVKDIVPPPKHEITGRVTIGPVSGLRVHRVMFPRPKNHVGQVSVSDSQQCELIGWYRSLNERTRQLIEAGEEPVRLTGRASTTGQASMNQDLSNRRETNVETVLRQYLGKDATIKPLARGEYEAPTPDDVESDDERVVTVEVYERFSEGETLPAPFTP
jgi:hypothetical protein